MKPLFTLLLLAIALASYAQPPSAYWYDLDRQKIETYQQPDVFAFRLKNGIDLDLILSQVIDSFGRDPIYGFHYLFFAKNTSAQDRRLVKDKIRSVDGFERDFQVFTHDTTIGYVKRQWYLSDDLILVAFQDPYITPAKVTDFAHRWGLQLHQAPGPGLPKGGRYVYIFKVLEPNRYAADIAHELIEREPETVYAADPNLHGIAQPCGGNDPWFAEQWYIENTGQLLWNGISGQNDADCDIDQAWDLGYSGEGVMVSVLDGFGFDLLHEDLIAKIDSPWSAIDQAKLPPDTAQTTWAHYAHGSHMLGMIGASGENYKGIKGVAYNARLNPIEIYPASSTIVVKGFQKVLELNGDVVNCSFTMPAYLGFGTVRAEIQNIKELGREQSGSVVVAGAGNTGDSLMYFPCGWPETICVVGTTPDDSLIRKYGKWTANPANSIGSCYGEWCDIAAPGADIATTDHSGNEGWLQGGYFPTFDGTSASTAITSAVCALILEKNENLSSNLVLDEVKDILLAGAEKVHPNHYNYQYYPATPGKSRYLAHGRINAYNSLLLTPAVGTEDQVSYIHSFTVVSPAYDEVKLLFTTAPKNRIQFTCHDSWGNKLKSWTESPGQHGYSLDISDLPTGVYLLQGNLDDGTLLKPAKFIKLNQ